MISARLEEFLEANKVAYTVLTHPQVFTAQGIAKAVHVSGKEVAKSVVVKADTRFVLAVVPASRRIDLARLQEVLNAKEVRLALESEFETMFTGCEVGAMPPFGHLYEMEVYVDQLLARDEEIVFNACTHKEAIRMKFSDFRNLAHPVIADFSSPG